MIVRTASGSRYEIDFDNKRVRQVSGRNAGAKLSTEWQDYDAITEPEVGAAVFIVWPEDDGHATITNAVVDIESEPCSCAACDGLEDLDTES